MAAALPLPRAALTVRLAVAAVATLAVGPLRSHMIAAGATLAAGILRSHTVTAGITAAGILRSLNLLRSLARAMAVRPRSLGSLGALSEREGCAQQCHCN